MMMVTRHWFVVDAENKILGRLSTRVARILSGKNKPDYVPYLDGGDFVVVVNAKKIRVTGKKMEQKFYYSHSGYPGGLKRRSLKEMLTLQPEEVILRAVKRMLPKNKLGARMLCRLKVYPDATHPHTAQRPEDLTV
jgi:large subunit ribosomal protein L13